jgi:hypothetical protein
MTMAINQNAGQNRNFYIGDKSFERVKHFVYLRTTLTSKKIPFMKNLRAD